MAEKRLQKIFPSFYEQRWKNAEKIKLKHGHAFYDDASEEEVFQIPIIGSDQQQPCNQLMIAEIIEARMTEIFELIQDELNRLGFSDVPGGFVLTGGVVKMPGVLRSGSICFPKSSENS